MSDKLRQAIEEEQEAKESADEANAAKSRFLASVSHELRTPLNAIIGYSEMLHDELDDEAQVDRPQFQSDLGKIVLSGRQLLALIDDILDLSKIETGKMTLAVSSFNPGEVLATTIESLRPILERNGNQLETTGLDAVPEIENDAVKFRQIVVNLLSNAAKFTDQGVIRISAGIPEGSDMICIEVSDTGIGMTEEQQAQVFEAFVQAEDSTSHIYGGSGLGLAICKDFCELMGGDITVASEPGKGSVFTVRLPADPASARAAA